MMLVTFTIWAMGRYKSLDGHYVFSQNITNNLMETKRYFIIRTSISSLLLNGSSMSRTLREDRE